MKFTLLFLFSICYISLNAQDSIQKRKSFCLRNQERVRPIRDTVIPAGPNEIYLNIAPLFTTLLGSIPASEANFSLMYKRVLKNPRFALRTGMAFKLSVNNYFEFFYPTDWYFDQTDSTRTVNKFDDGTRNKIQLNIGMEFRRKGNKRWGTFAGLDLIAGFYKSSYSLYNVLEMLDTTGMWNPVANDPIVFLDYKQSFSYYAGISPKFGLRYAFNKNWMMMLQTSFEAYFLKSDYYTRNSFGTAILDYKNSSYNFNMNGFFDEFSIAYRF